MSDGGLHLVFKKHLVGAHIQRLESGMTGGGIPDVNACRDGVEAWIEYKSIRGWVLPKTNRRPAQVGWIEGRLRHGGRCFVAVRQLGMGRDDLWLFSGWALRDLHQGLRLHAVPPAHLLGHWHGPPSKWDWPKVNSLLFS
jgi:hypothetical protein